MNWFLPPRKMTANENWSDAAWEGDRPLGLRLRLEAANGGLVQSDSLQHFVNRAARQAECTSDPCLRAGPWFNMP